MEKRVKEGENEGGGEREREEEQEQEAYKSSANESCLIRTAQ